MRKMTPNWLKIDFSDTFRESHFSTMNIENNYDEVYIAKNYFKNRV